MGIFVIVSLGRANNDVVKDEGNEHYKMVHVQWWMLSKKGTMNDVELYLHEVNMKIHPK